MASEVEWNRAQVRSQRRRGLSGVVGLVSYAALSIPAGMLGGAEASGFARYLVTAGAILVFMAPLVTLLVVMANRDQRAADAGFLNLAQELSEAVRAADEEAAQREVQAGRQVFERRLTNALEMTADEPEVIDVVERSFRLTLPDAPVELLLADNSHAHLIRVASASPTGTPPGCGVGSPDGCPAARRAQVQRFADSNNLDACPKLRDRSEGGISGLCVPVSIMGRTVGVIHATGPAGVQLPDDKVSDLGTLANLAGARIGLLRVMADTQIQAATDSLTGLMNRRSFEQKLASVRTEATELSVAMADLDHFKTLNDTYGHETGDRALRLFAQVLTESVRAQDLVCRHGGEEFVIALPGCGVAQARRTLDAIRPRLDAAITVAGLPRFTVSFGVVAAGKREDLPLVINRADVALFQAKRDGRNRVVAHDPTGQTVPAVGERHVGRAEDGAPAQVDAI